MRKILILVLFLYNISHACGLCTVYSPQTLASINVTSDNKTIKDVEVVLKLTEEFTQQLRDLYDINANEKLDKDELLKIQEIFETYAKPKRYFLTVSYDKVIRKETFNKINVFGFQSYIENNILHFRYKAQLNYTLYANYFLRIKVEDDESFFLISLNEKNITFNFLNVQKVLNENSVIFAINEIKNNASNPTDELIVSSETKKEVKEQTSYLKLFTKKIKGYLVSIKNGDNMALLSLLIISFIYGVIHAIGPGHGKSLAFSYFVANKSSITKAFIISQASAFIHIIGALILVVISVTILQSVLNNFVNDSVVILTKISAVLIILLASYMLINKLRKKSCACSSCQTTQNSWQLQNPKESVLQTKSFLKNKQDLYFVITAGLIPCPGTVVLFVYAFILKTYFAVFLSSLFISFGMGLVIFASAFLGIGMKKVTQTSHFFTQAIEIIAPLFILLLGVLLYYNANIF